MYLVLFLMAFASVFIGHSVNAGNLCVEKEGIDTQCFYYDASTCKQKASEVGGTCVLHYASSVPVLGASSYCAVYPNYSTECVYETKESCELNKNDKNTVCLLKKQGAERQKHEQD